MTSERIVNKTMLYCNMTIARCWNHVY